MKWFALTVVGFFAAHGLLLLFVNDDAAGAAPDFLAALVWGAIYHINRLRECH